jgi:hypothetical protein
VCDAQRGLFTVVLAEALDRISRDQADVATFYKHLKFAGVAIVTLAEGEISELHVGLKGTMNALFLKDLAMKTHRGLRGRVEKGKAGGGLCYGYKVVRTFDANGEPIRGDREIVPHEADTIRRIFREFASGKSPKAIAVDLNKESIPGPLGRAWGDTSIRGHVSRGRGILNNELYTGVLVCNRQRFLKDPSTGKRVSRPNPESQWIRTEVDRLVSAEAVAEAVRAKAEQMNRLNHDRRAQAASDQKALQKIERAIAGIMEAIEDGMYQPSMKARMADLERQKAEITARQLEAPTDIPDVHPNIANLYRRRVERLTETLNDPDGGRQAAEALRSLIGDIVLTPGEKRGEVHATLCGELFGILDFVRSEESRSPGKAMPAVAARPRNQNQNAKSIYSKACYPQAIPV